MSTQWIPSNPSASLNIWAEDLHTESKRMFLQDKTHAHIIFMFKEREGVISINPVPPKTTHEQINGGICNAVKEHNLYGVIHVGEAWTYFIKDKKDHTAFQLLDGEMRVSDLKEEDKVEVLYLRMESRDGKCIVYLDKILRNGDNVVLGECQVINGEGTNWFI